ncbi:MAG TPA: reverse transcriptase family protein [Burkholderiales bacterium]
MKPHSESRRIARGLANALAASGDDRAQAREHLAQALGRDQRWLSTVQRAVRQRFGAYGGAALARRHAELCEFIATRPALLAAFDNIREPPRLAGYFTFHATMGAAPLSMGGIAAPALATPAELARWLGLTTDELDWFAGVRVRDGRRLAEPLNHYRYLWVPKASGGMRLLEIPKRRLAAMQRRILDGILYFVPPHEAAHGFRPRRSALTHAAGHVGKEAVLRMDLRDFFVSVRASRAHALFASLGYPAPVARLLTGLTCHITPKAVLRERISANAAGYDPAAWRVWSAWFSPHLPQGAPSSPALANLCAFNLDLRLGTLAADAGVHYTRYADDLAFSGERALARGVESFKRTVAVIAAGEGFAVNTRKTHLMLRSQRQQLTGVVVNARPNVRRTDYDELKAILHNCVRHGPVSQNRAGLPDFRAHLAGRITHICTLNPVRGVRLAAAFDAIAWPEQGV